MKRLSNYRIFGRTDPEDFVGREAELEHLRAYAKCNAGQEGFALLTTPSSGSSELLRQFCDRLFTGQRHLIPFYFQVNRSDNSAQDAALRFLREFLLQTVAFRRQDAGIIAASPEICEIAELAMPSDGYWIDRIVDTCESDSKLNDERSFIRNCLSAPLRAAIHGAETFVFIDDIHVTANLTNGMAFLEDIVDIFSRSSIRVVLAGHRRFLFGKTPFKVMAIEPLSFEDAGKLIERCSNKTGVAVNDQTRDLIAVQLRGNVHHIENHFAAARSNSVDFGTFQSVQTVYTEEIFGGRTSKYYDSIFHRIMPDSEIQKRCLRLLAENIKAKDNVIPIAYWKKHSGLMGSAFDAFVNALNAAEVANVSSGTIKIDPENTPLCDYIDGRLRLEVINEKRALTIGDALSIFVRRAPVLMARFYRRGSSVGLRELMKAFDGRQISSALIDYGRFRSELKGADPEHVRDALREDGQTTPLPRIIYTAHTAALYPKLNEICDPERSAVAIGFAGPSEKEESVWIAAEIDSKLEATRELTEFWCDRLEMAAVNCRFDDFKIWLIAPEGFSSDALDALQKRNAIGSSRRQVELLTEFLDAATGTETDEPSGNEYEFVIPMGENTELLAVCRFEEIAKRHEFPTKPTNQIKTALIEACINAEEHSLSPDRKITLKFLVDLDRVTITITNRGVRLADKKPTGDSSDAARRGWGLKLMKGLMDDVKVEQTDDGTQITMLKSLK